MEENKLIGYVHSLETFGLVDGPGIRYVVFLQGCPMRCAYCHNPDTWIPKRGSTEYTPEALFERAYRYKTYWRDNGGITVSGGEPLLQIEFVTEFFKLAKEKGIHTTLDTSGNLFTYDEPFYSKFLELMKYTDLVMLDIKHTDPQKHFELCGKPNANIMEMAKCLSDLGKDTWIRRVLVPGWTDDEEELKNLKTFVDGLKSVKKLEILPYHTLAINKYQNLGIPYRLDGVRPPTDEEVKKAEDILGIVHQQFGNQKKS